MAFRGHRHLSPVTRDQVPRLSVRQPVGRLVVQILHQRPEQAPRCPEARCPAGSGPRQLVSGAGALGHGSVRRRGTARSRGGPPGWPPTCNPAALPGDVGSRGSPAPSLDDRPRPVGVFLVAGVGNAEVHLDVAAVGDRVDAGDSDGTADVSVCRPLTRAAVGFWTGAPGRAEGARRSRRAASDVRVLPNGGVTFGFDLTAERRLDVGRARSIRGFRV